MEWGDLKGGTLCPHQSFAIFDMHLHQGATLTSLPWDRQPAAWEEKIPPETLNSEQLFPESSGASIPIREHLWLHHLILANDNRVKE